VWCQDFELEKKMLGEKAHRRLKELEQQVRKHKIPSSQRCRTQG
jgi:hypothetical protein